MRSVFVSIFLFLVFTGRIFSQKDSLLAYRDSLKLPFKISSLKKISDEDYLHKREGTYVTGIPSFSSDPVNGFGVGGNGFLIFNGKRSDPFFAYTPYRAKLELALFTTTKHESEIELKLDMPYFLNSKWRLRVVAEYMNNPNPLYFGFGESSLNGLSYYPDNDSTKSPVNNAQFDEYDEALAAAGNDDFNTYKLNEQAVDVNLERNFFDGHVRVLIGYEFGHINISPFEGRSLLRDDANSNKIFGVGNFITSIAQCGIAYDTRDLESDPSKGIFAEIFEEYSNNIIGSKFNFNKSFVHFNYYTKVFPKIFKKVIFACRLGFGGTSGNAPFYEYRDQPTSEGDIEALGGPSSIRGYKENRFIAKVTSFNNAELRCRFWQFKLLKQHIALSGVPFYDIGGVWDNFSNVFKKNNLRYAEGLGLRIAWNVNTIVRLDYAISKEDKQFFLEFNHSF